MQDIWNVTGVIWVFNTEENSLLVDHFTFDWEDAWTRPVNTIPVKTFSVTEKGFSAHVNPKRMSHRGTISGTGLGWMGIDL